MSDNFGISMVREFQRVVRVISSKTPALATNGSPIFTSNPMALAKINLKSKLIASNTDRIIESDLQRLL